MSADHSHDHGHGEAADGAVHVHIASPLLYVAVFVALIFLTFLTVKVSYYDFGDWNTIIAVAIATAKASLVAAFFMHLRHDKVFNTITFLGAFAFLALFILMTYADLGTRSMLPNGYVQHISRETGKGAPGGEPETAATQNDLQGEAPGAAEPGHPAEKKD